MIILAEQLYLNLKGLLKTSNQNRWYLQNRERQKGLEIEICFRIVTVPLSYLAGQFLKTHFHSL